MIKPTELKIRNIGKIESMDIPIDKPLILFYGEIKQGKSTILNAIRWVFGGEFPDDIIRHGAKDASIEFHFEGGMIGRSFYRSKDGKTTKARPVIFVRNGKPVPQPVNEIKRFLNPFLIDQDYLRKKNELERKRYFVDLFAVDTTALDTELFNSQREAEKLRAKIAGYGEIKLVEVKPVDIGAAKAELQKINDAYNDELKKATDAYDAEVRRVNEANREIDRHNLQVDNDVQKRAGIVDEIANLKQQLALAESKLRQLDEFIAANPKKAAVTIPTKPELTKPDTSKLEAMISEGAAQNVRHEQYLADKARAEAKETDEKNLRAMEARQRAIKEERQAKLKSISDSCGIKGLAFDDEGNFIYEGTTAGMISDSQLMKLSAELSSLYPEGFGISLLDRAESLGKSIFEFVDRAKEEKKTILATIVGERPATTPPEIGVWVVEEGKLS